jgi:hypothetical protein
MLQVRSSRPFSLLFSCRSVKLCSASFACAALAMNVSHACAGMEEDTLPPPSANKHAVADLSSGEGTKEGQTAPQTFRDFYVKTFSSAFASELFDLRQVCAFERG